MNEIEKEIKENEKLEEKMSLLFEGMTNSQLIRTLRVLSSAISSRL